MPEINGETYDQQKLQKELAHLDWWYSKDFTLQSAQWNIKIPWLGHSRKMSCNKQYKRIWTVLQIRCQKISETKENKKETEIDLLYCGRVECMFIENTAAQCRIVFCVC